MDPSTPEKKSLMFVTLTKSLVLTCRGCQALKPAHHTPGVDISSAVV